MAVAPAWSKNLPDVDRVPFERACDLAEVWSEHGHRTSARFSSVEALAEALELSPGVASELTAPGIELHWTCSYRGESDWKVRGASGGRLTGPRSSGGWLRWSASDNGGDFTSDDLGEVLRWVAGRTAVRV